MLPIPLPHELEKTVPTSLSAFSLKSNGRVREREVQLSDISVSASGSFENPVTVFMLTSRNKALLYSADFQNVYRDSLEEGKILEEGCFLLCTKLALAKLTT